MRHGRIVDTTAEIAAGDSLGDAVLTSVLSRIQDAHERTIFLAHVALDLPVPSVARAFGLDPMQVEETVKALLRKLRSDETLSAQLRDIRRAGRPEHYLLLAEKLDLQDWLCARCGRPMVQPKVGRPRKTCSDTCRVALSLAGGQGWKDAKDRASLPQMVNRLVSPGEEIRRRASLALTVQETDAMRALLRKITDSRDGGRWTSRDYRVRNKALMLLGFTCPVQLSAEDLAALTLEQIRLSSEMAEIVLHWGKGQSRTRQYATVPRDRDPDLCPFRAILAWQTRLYEAGHRIGPLFPRMAYWDSVSERNRSGMGGRVMASVIGNAMQEAHVAPRGFSESTLLPTFLRDASRITNMEVSDYRRYVGRS